jgi:hypothetical protein
MKYLVEVSFDVGDVVRSSLIYLEGTTTKLSWRIGGENENKELRSICFWTEQEDAW